MENAGTFRVILFGTALVFGGCLVWLLMSRGEIKSLRATLDQSKLKHEALLSEKLLIEKSLTKTNKKLDTTIGANNNLSQELTTLTQQLEIQHAENDQIKRRVQKLTQDYQQKQRIHQELIMKLDSSAVGNNALVSLVKFSADSIDRLKNRIAGLTAALEEATRRSIDQTLVTAEKRNSRITGKARRTRRLVAQVELPIKLNELTFQVERPDGSVLSSEGTVTTRQLATESQLTASLDYPFTSVPTKKMEVTYKPKEQLTAGTYVFKIFNGGNYVGSLNVKLR